MTEGLQPLKKLLPLGMVEFSKVTLNVMVDDFEEEVLVLEVEGWLPLPLSLEAGVFPPPQEARLINNAADKR